MGYREVQAEVFKRLGFVPTEGQLPIFDNRARIKFIAGGARGGKSMTSAKELECKWPGGELFWLLGSDYEGTRGEWDHLARDFEAMGVLRKATKNIDPGEMELAGGVQIVTKSAKYPVKIATVAPDGILVCEAAQIDWETYLRCIERLAEKRGWMVLSGTYEESYGWFVDMVEYGKSYNEEGISSFSLPTWSNLATFPGGRQDPELLRLEQSMTPERFLERFGGEACPVSGRVVKEFNNRVHVGNYLFKGDLPVEIAVDPGYAGAHAVLAIQRWGEQVVLVDEVYLTGYITSEIIDICKQRPWWGMRAGGAIDIAGKQHQAMEAPIEIWLRQAGIHLLTKKVPEEDGIDLLRTYLKPNPINGSPKILVNSSCRGFIAECGGGKSPVEGGGIWMRDPNLNKPIDRNNHSAKALIYYLANKFGYTGRFNRAARQMTVSYKVPREQGLVRR